MKKLSKDEINQRLAPDNIILVGEYMNTRTPTDFLHITCGFKWTVAPRHVVLHHSGCPKCNDTKKNNDIIDKILIGNNIIRLGNYVNCDIPTEFQCMICNNKWITRPRSIINEKTGCPKCAVISNSLNNDIVDQRLIGTNIIRIGKYTKIDKPIDFKCLECMSIFNIKPLYILNKGRGCNVCTLSKGEKLIFSILKECNIIFNYHFRCINIFNNYYNSLHNVDFYLPSLKIIIEYNGEQHYKPVCFGKQSMKLAKIKFNKQKNRDHKLEKICNANNIKLIWIDGRKYYGTKLLKYLTETLIPTLKE